MFNANEFRALIISKGKTMSDIANAMSIGASTLSRKIKRNGDFTRAEITAYKVFLNAPVETIERIFLRCKLRKRNVEAHTEPTRQKCITKEDTTKTRKEPTVNKKLYAIWQDNQVKGYIALTQEQADEINRIPDVGLYVGGDAFAGNPRCGCWVYSPCTWTSEDGRTTFNVSKAPHCSECGRAVLMNNEMNGRFAYCPHCGARMKDHD